MIKKILIIFIVIMSNSSFTMQRFGTKFKKIIPPIILRNIFIRYLNCQTTKTPSSTTFKTLKSYLETVQLHLENENLTSLEKLFNDHRKLSLLVNTRLEIRSFLVNNLNHSHIDLIKLLLKENVIEQNEILLIAASRGVINIIKFLLRNGADINCKDGFGNTPIILAAKFLEKSDNPRNNRSALIVIEYLLKNEAKITKNDKGLTAFHILSNLTDKIKQN